MPAKSRRRVRHNITAPREKSHILKSFCSNEEFELIKEWASKGAVFIVLGSEYTQTRDFYRGLYQIMYSPVSNGACVYDSHYQYREANSRPYVTISLNDPVNTTHAIDNIKLLDRYRNTVLYTVDYTHEEEEELATKLEIAQDIMGMLQLDYFIPDGKVTSIHTRVTKLEKLVDVIAPYDTCPLYRNLALNYLFSASPYKASKIYVADGHTGLAPFPLEKLFMEDSYEMITVGSKPFSFRLYENLKIQPLKEAVHDLYVRIQNCREDLMEYIDELTKSSGTAYRCARLFLHKEAELVQEVSYVDQLEANREECEQDD